MKSKVIIRCLIVLSLAVITMSLMSACSENEEEPINGGWEHGGVSYLEGEDWLTAHNKTFTIPTDSESLTFNFFSYGITQIDFIGGSDNITAQIVDIFDPSSIVVDEYNIPSKCQQRVIFSRKLEKLPSKEEKAIFRIYSRGMNGFIDDVTIVVKP